jgi:transposase
MKKEIIRIGCGLDVSKDKFHACVGVVLSDGSFVVKGSKHFKNAKEGITAFLSWLGKLHEKYGQGAGLPFQVLLETTGVYHEQVCSRLHDASWPVCLEVASRVKKYLQSIGQYSKTDKLDAKGICRMACERKFKRWKPFSPHLLTIRAALRHRKSLIGSRDRLTNQLHALNCSAHGDKKVASSIKRLVKALDKEILKIEEHVHELYKSDTRLYERLEPIIKSVKGLGRIGALTTVAETNGFEEVRSAKQLASYAGYDIIENQSGKTSRPTRISKRGNARIRRELYMCVMTMSRYEDSPYAGFFARIRSRNPKAYNVAGVAMQRKLLILIYTLFKNGTVYDPNYEWKAGKKSSPEPCPELHEIAPA